MDDAWWALVFEGRGEVEIKVRASIVTRARCATLMPSCARLDRRDDARGFVRSCIC